MGETTHTSESTQTERTDEKVDLRKFRKRLTTPEEIKEIHDNRKKYREEDLRSKMARISKQLKEDGRL
tara:strand:+ start:30 stop:233 length:204 start_codon:yes stop_codon:yes gene_type:complete